MAMVIYLFGGYVDLPNEHGITRQRGPSAKLHLQSRSGEKEVVIMNPRRHTIAAWNFSTWFVLLSPVIGILFGLFGAFLVLR